MSESEVTLSCASSGSEAYTCYLVDRIDTYRELSHLLHGSEESAADSIVRLVSATRSCRCMSYIDEDLIQSLSREAFLGLLDPDARREFAIERAQLFGERGCDSLANIVPPCESTYLDVGDGERVDSVLEAYAHAGYVPPVRLAALNCPDHIATELDFMAHCLERVSLDAASADCAHDFFANHLAGWAVLFAVATERRATHVAIRYTALVLDKFFACEAVTFKYGVPSLCALRELSLERAEV